ncbi:MAG: response regulator, partial [Pyrinomonadaceae bacterium]
MSASVSAMFLVYNSSESFFSTASSFGAESTQNESRDESRKKRRALVVDDVSDVTDMLSLLLSRAGYDVVTADSAAAALAVAREHRFDVIISDIGMPEMNGYELAQALRAFQGYETVPM